MDSRTDDIAQRQVESLLAALGKARLKTKLGEERLLFPSPEVEI